MERETTFAVVDIGSTKITSLIASRNNQDELAVLGCGTVPVEDIFRKGILTNIERTSKALTLSLSMAEEQAEIKLTNLTIGFSGEHLRSFNSLGVVPVSKNENQITKVKTMENNSSYNHSKFTEAKLEQVYRVQDMSNSLNFRSPFL